MGKELGMHCQRCGVKSLCESVVHVLWKCQAHNSTRLLLGDSPKKTFIC